MPSRTSSNVNACYQAPCMDHPTPPPNRRAFGIIPQTCGTCQVTQCVPSQASYRANQRERIFFMFAHILSFTIFIHMHRLIDQLMSDIHVMMHGITGVVQSKRKLSCPTTPHPTCGINMHEQGSDMKQQRAAAAGIRCGCQDLHDVDLVR